MKMVKRCLVAVVAFLLLSCFVSFVFASGEEFDQTSVVVRVVDGNTFVLNTGERVRLAGIDAPQEGQHGYNEATDYLEDLIEGKTVYLDIDNASRTDFWGRLISVVYIEHNSTYFENINKVLIDEYYSKLNNYTNSEFNPASWSRYISKNAIPEFPTVATIIIVLGTVTLGILATNKHYKKIL